MSTRPAQPAKIQIQIQIQICTILNTNTNSNTIKNTVSTRPEQPTKSIVHPMFHFICIVFDYFLISYYLAILCHVHTNKIPITREILVIYSIHTSTEWPFKSICDVLHFVAEYLHKLFNFLE